MCVPQYGYHRDISIPSSNSLLQKLSAAKVLKRILLLHIDGVFDKSQAVLQMLNLAGKNVFSANTSFQEVLKSNHASVKT